MFFLAIRTRPQHRAFEITEDAVRDAAIHALIKAGSRSAALPDCISTETKTVLKKELMRGQIEIRIFTSASDWIGLSTDNKMLRFTKEMKDRLPYLKEGDLSVFIVDAQYYSL